MAEPEPMRMIPVRIAILWLSAVMIPAALFLSLMVHAAQAGSGDPSSSTTAAASAFPNNNDILFGVMVDYGRHAFPIDWLKLFMEETHRMGFNAIHLTLTSDQRFNLFLQDDHEEGDYVDGLTFAVPNRNISNNNLQGQQNISTASEDHDGVYTRKDWRALTEFVRSRLNNTMTIVPELSVPIFAGSWAGGRWVTGRKSKNDSTTNTTTTTTSASGERFVVDCPKYVCSVGSAIPLNIHHPNMKDILRHVFQRLESVMGQRPPFLHLGSNDVSLAAQCWNEAAAAAAASKDKPGSYTHRTTWRQPDYGLFEETLAGILFGELGYHPEQVIRQWDLDEPHDHTKKNPNHQDVIVTGKLSQYKDHRLALRDTGPYLLQPKELNLASSVWDRMSGWDVYKLMVDIVQLHYERDNFRGMILSTEAMDTNVIKKRNVIGRLLAVSMAVHDVYHPRSSTGRILSNQADFNRTYRSICENLFPADSSMSPLGGSNAVRPSSFCQLLGGTVTPDGSISNSHVMLDGAYKSQFKEMWNDWVRSTCHRLTETQERFQLQIVAAPVVQSIQDVAFARFWQGLNGDVDTLLPHKDDVATNDTREFGERVATVEPTVATRSTFRTMVVPRRGVLVDLVETPVGPDELRDLMEVLVRLGLNTMQLSMINEWGCSLQLRDLKQLYHLVVPNPRHADPLTDDDLTSVVRAAVRLGIEVIPELSVTTGATGWYHAGHLVDCPKSLCETGQIVNDVTRGSLLPVVLEVIRELRSIFYPTTSYIHLGGDERNVSAECWREVGTTTTTTTTTTPDYDAFETKLSELLVDKGWYHPSKILRWENREGIVYPNRTGDVTQYRYSIPNEPGSFTTVRVSPDADPWTVYSQTRALVASQPRGVLVQVSPQDLHGSRKRLVAFAAALSSTLSPMNDSAAVEAFASEICTHHHHDDDVSRRSLCSVNSSVKVGAVPTTPEGRRQQLCRAMTKLCTDHLQMRPVALSSLEMNRAQPTQRRDD